MREVQGFEYFQNKKIILNKIKIIFHNFVSASFGCKKIVDTKMKLGVLDLLNEE